jgi:hypothetical protein
MQKPIIRDLTDEYMKALEAASVKGQITPLAEFIAQEMREWVPERTGKS